jgi:uncharacterized protein YecE (DUF72 family)
MARRVLPRLPGLLPQTAFVTAETGYVRLHGRNTDKWWRHQHAWERYDYTYSEEELRGWVPHLTEMEKEAENLFVFANNHYQAQAVATIRQIRMHIDETKSVP